MVTTRIHFVAFCVALTTLLLFGCVVAELHATISPVPPYFDLTVKGLVDTPPEATKPTGFVPLAPEGQPASAPAANVPMTLPASGQ